jgi:hypothetical protein
VSRNNPENVWRKVILPDGTARVTIFTSGGRYGVFVAGPRDEKTCPDERFADRDAAMRFAFEIVERLRANSE